MRSGAACCAKAGRMLVRTPNWLGDAVMSLESLRGILRTHPGTTFWSHPRVADLFAFFFPGAPTVLLGDPIPRGRHRTLLLMPDSFRAALLGLNAGIPERIGLSRPGRDVLLTRTVAPQKGRIRHHSLTFEILAEAVGSSAAPLPLAPFTPDGHLAVFPGARYSRGKRWQGFLDAVKALEMPAVFYGPPEERQDLGALAEGCRARVETGLSLSALAERLSHASCCLGNDSGGVHLAAALGVPTVSVFCSTSPCWTGPRGARAVSLAPDVSCAPCFGRTCRDGSFRCTEAVPWEQAVREVLRVR